jgi:hypothetical protein
LTPVALFAALSVVVVDEGTRVRQGDAIEGGAAVAEVEALRGEHAAFQIVVEARDDDDIVSVTVPRKRLTMDVFVEHFVDVTRRSRNDDDEREALAFTLPSRPPDAAALGRVPDALIPLGIAPAWAYPVALSPGERTAFWVEVFVPEDFPPGTYDEVIVVEGDGGTSVRVPVKVRVLAPVLPYRATSAFAYYERPTLERRFVDADAAEIQLVQTLHAHHLDVLCQVTSPEHADRIRGAYDGSWFTPRAGYAGPGVGVPASLAAIGTYGTLGEPSEEKLPLVHDIASRIPYDIEDVFVYAIDETCDSPRGPKWRSLLRESGLAPRVVAGHTCHIDPGEQDVDIVMIPAQAYDPDTAAAARKEGRRVWIYNGQLPYAAPPNLDVPLSSLALNGWIGASYDVGRWFYWETIFWHDGNRGGRGPTDVFTNVETFHNADGDTSLYDGLLLFPGRTKPSLGPHDVGFDGVLPSMRLKSLRRGLEDAGLLALASQIDPRTAADITRRAVAAALDEVGRNEPALLTFDPAELRELRRELREIAARGGTSTERDAVDRALSALRAERALRRPASAVGKATSAAEAFVLFGLPAVIFGLGFLSAAALDFAASRRPNRRRSPG